MRDLNQSNPDAQRPDDRVTEQPLLNTGQYPEQDYCQRLQCKGIDKTGQYPRQNYCQGPEKHSFEKERIGLLFIEGGRPPYIDLR